VSQYQKGKTSLDFTEARDSEWQWHQLDHVQVCTSLQTDNHASATPLSFFCRPDALPGAQPTASKHSFIKYYNILHQPSRVSPVQWAPQHSAFHQLQQAQHHC